MRLVLAARVLKRIADEGRLALLPQLPPSISSILHEDPEAIAAALERLPARGWPRPSSKRASEKG